MRALSRLLILGIVLAVLVVIAAPSLLGQTSALRSKVPSLLANQKTTSRQSAAQISVAEFARARTGLSPSAVRGLFGEPESTSHVELEGLRLDCWYYGIAAASGAYQFCFANGKLSRKARYSP